MDTTLQLLEQRVEEAAARMRDLADARDRLGHEVEVLRQRLERESREAVPSDAVDRQTVAAALRRALDELRAD